MNDKHVLTVEQLELQKAKTELANSVVAQELLRQQARTQRSQQVGQMTLGAIALITAVASAWSSCRANDKSDASYRATSQAVNQVASSQQQQYHALIDLQDFAASSASANSSVEYLPVPSASNLVVVMVDKHPPKRPPKRPPEPPHVELPPAPPAP